MALTIENQTGQALMGDVKQGTLKLVEGP